jgi:UDP-N-acetylglucosamine 2-epimerase (non-hydrolysing)
MSITVDLIAGARPNFMKVAPILRAMEATGYRLRPRLVHTGQHYDPEMSDVFFEQLAIRKPDLHLGVGSGSHGAQTAKILAAYEEVLLKERPAALIVVGDVNSTMACTVAAVKLGVQVAHVEAGLRSMDRTMPEEINRVVTDCLADVLLVSDPSGEVHLKREGIDPGRIEFVGNVMIDTLVQQLPKARSLDVPRRTGVTAGGYIYVTLHRPSNVDEPERLKILLQSLSAIGQRLPLVFPIHPRTRGRLDHFGQLKALEANSAYTLLPPQGYLESLALMDSARLVITDSGGIQEESSFLGIPCLTVRPNTERPVTVDLGTSTIVGDRLAELPALVDEILAGRYKKGQAIPGWDGHAAERVVDVLTKRWA